MKPRVVENHGTMELLPDGRLSFTNWAVEGGEQPITRWDLQIMDAVMGLLQEKRAEAAASEPPAFIDVPLIR